MEDKVKRELVRPDYVKPGQVVLERDIRYSGEYEYRKVAVVEVIKQINHVVIAFGDKYSSTEKEILAEGFKDLYKTVPLEDIFVIKETTREDKLDLIETEEKEDV